MCSPGTGLFSLMASVHGIRAARLHPKLSKSCKLGGKRRRFEFFPRTGAFQEFYQLWQKRLRSQDLETETIKEEMNRVNPVFIPRNHKIEQVIEAGLKGDFSLFHEMNEVLKKPYEEQEEFSGYKLAPRPGAGCPGHVLRNLVEGKRGVRLLGKQSDSEEVFRILS